MSGIVVCPVRFTKQIEAMQAFLETLGLRPRIESEGGSWVDMVAGGGMVGLHTVETSVTGAVPGETASASRPTMSASLPPDSPRPVSLTSRCTTRRTVACSLAVIRSAT